MKRILLTLTVLFTTFYGFSQENDNFKKDTQKLISIVSGASFDAVTTSLKQFIPADKVDAAEMEIKALMPELYETMAKIYMEEFTHSEIKELLKFYETPIGKKMAEKTSVLTQKGLAEGAKWGREKLTPIIQKYMKQ
ncbi:DUF2059 domain-containing protein [Capnocytophaga felis]|uniref:DUF2059 domain-containing protein n=1 Tax=Capnocytophaga felis TaxID=2267611 RepID=A0A5M4BAG4_9FLAO|nr:DUF2059 domain-containing protein [Capnocytophaga felis]GET46106.1 hypothetical protein RCZ01_14080 [Capnocytophaga felis]GET48898.1 hypothetical protein RCZ02_17290 [Capnocytophaga felis]